jgi:chemotaxis protein MotB
MSRRRHRHHEEEHENHERWLITYADMITLLMAFFVMMYGMSILDLKKFADFKSGAANQLGKSPVIVGGQGILAGGTGVAEAAAPPIGSGARDGASDATEVRGDVKHEQLGQLVKEVQRRLHDAGLDNEAELQVDPRGLVITLPDTVAFESGSAFISIDGRGVLDQVSVALAHIDNQIVVEGHTDDRPTNGRGGYATNWELSTTRATQVLRWLVQIRHIPAPRLSAAGYADTRPRYQNDTPAHRAANRRVEIVIVTPPEESSNG